jgi:hypothetical protein
MNGRSQRAIVLLLRLGGAITFSAFFAIFLPVDWMAATHRWLGLGEFPRAPIVDYLARSVAAFYGFHGCLLFLVSTDPIRYRTIVSFIAAMNVLFGLILLGVDFHAGLPALWTAFEGPPIVALGIILAVLNRR